MPQDDLRKRLEAVAKQQGSDPLRKRLEQAKLEKLPVAPNPKVDMKTSKWPGIVRGAAGSLPVVGAIGGAVAAAPETAGVGAVAGGALGAAAGESLRQNILNDIFGREKGSDETDPLSKKGLAQTGIAGVVGGASELPAAIAQGYGGYVLSKLASAKSSKEIGDVLKAFNDVHPFKVTKEGMKGAMEASNRMLSKQYGRILKSYGGSVDLDSILTSTRQYATAADQNFATEMGRPGYKGVTNTLNRVIAAAKTKAGIPASTPMAGQATTALAKVGQGGAAQQGGVTLKELADFQTELRRIIRYERPTNPTVSGVVEDAIKQTSRDIGNTIKQAAPDAGPVLDKMTDIHAAISGLNKYKMGHGGALAVSAALRPRTAAAVSPAVAAATPWAVDEAKKAGKAVVGGLAH